MILVTNDDGVYSPGIQVLAKRLREIDTVVIVAPDRERSAAGHSMTLHRPLLIEEIKEGMYSVNGTPTDCVNIAVKGLLKETPKFRRAGRAMRQLNRMMLIIRVERLNRSPGCSGSNKLVLPIANWFDIMAISRRLA